MIAVYYRRSCLDWGYIGNASYTSFSAFQRQLIDLKKRGFVLDAITNTSELRKIAVQDGQFTLVSDVFAVRISRKG